MEAQAPYMGSAEIQKENPGRSPWDTPEQADNKENP
jgi:hypothetical protein